MARAALLLAAALLAPPAGAAGASWSELCAANAGHGGIADCARALAEDPGNLVLRRLYAKSLLLGGGERQAIEEYRRIAELLPDDAAAHYDLASAYLALYRYGAAIPPLERALALQPDHVEAMMLAGIAYQSLGRAAEAFPIFLRLAERGDVLAMHDVAVSLERGLGTGKDERAALHWLTRAAEAGHVGALDRLAEVYREGRLGVAPDAAAADAWAARAAAERGRPLEE